MMSPSSPQDTRQSSSLSKRTRSFKGCITCRRRRMKCDEKRPRCNTCQSSGIPCGGYSKSIFFDHEDSDGKASSNRFRRPLLTEEQRERMSSQIASSVAPDRALWHIAKIDEECEEMPETQSLQKSFGPFGVFRVGLGSPESMPAEDAVVPEQLPDAVEFASTESWGEDLDPADEVLMPTTTTFVDSLGTEGHGMEEWWSIDTQWTTLQPMASQDWWVAASRINCFPGQSSDANVLDLDQNTLATAFPAPQPASPKAAPSSTVSVQAMLTSDMSIPPTVNLETPHDAVYLLKHYSTKVLQGLTPYRHSKTPWHILFIPHAKACLAAITMGEPLTHASLCTFFGILSTSACSLSFITGSKKWLEQGHVYKQRARNHARLMLPTAYDVPKVSKYKVTLMALLTMIQISTVTRNRDQTECYFLETEKFIRVKGLGRRKSRKVRLLHHCYVFERLLHESTFPGRKDSQHRQHVRQAIESSGAGSFSYDDLSFAALDLQNLDQQMLRIKGQEEGENDLHLKYPGVWAATQYPEIFGLPEIYVFILSAIIRLGRWKEDAFAGSMATGLREYMRGAKELETFLLRLQHKPDSVAVAPLSDPSQQHCQSLLETLSKAMQQALEIHFYRRVYDIDPSTLQTQVKAVSECLQRCEVLNEGAGYGSMRLIWPAYIAASEALDEDLRGRFMTWFGNCAKTSGLGAFEDTREDIEKIWAKQRHVEAN